MIELNGFNCKIIVFVWVLYYIVFIIYSWKNIVHLLVDLS